MNSPDVSRFENRILDLLTGCLVIIYVPECFGVDGHFSYAITPNFIATLDGTFKDNIVYAATGYGDKFAKAFLDKEVHSRPVKQTHGQP